MTSFLRISVFTVLVLLMWDLEGSNAKKKKLTGDIWALLVAGSRGWSNYRHQADICHAYNILRRNGVKEENIITMIFDDIANNSNNPTPGIIINQPNGTDVYKNVKKDYTGTDVNPQNFINVLTGNATGMKGIGTGRVIKSNRNDFVFVNFVDHGGPGVLYFSEDVLQAVTLISYLKLMRSARRFRMMTFYVEACFAGSMFDTILSDNMDIFVMAAADPHESSYACYFDKHRQVYLGDTFSVHWMHEAEKETLSNSSLNHIFEQVRTVTNQSHVEEYGDLDIGNTELSYVIGDRDAYIRSMNEKPDLTVNKLKAQLKSMRNKVSHQVRKSTVTQNRNLTKNDVKEFPDELPEDATTINPINETDSKDTVLFENKKELFNFTNGPFVTPGPETGITSQLNATLNTIRMKLLLETNKTRADELEKQIEFILEARIYADRIISKIILNYTNGDLKKSDELIHRRKSVDMDNMYCVMDLTTFFSDYCFNLVHNTYVRQFVQVFINACSASWTDHVTPLIEGIKSSCKNIKKPPAYIV